MFAFPLRSGATTLGALTLYQHIAGELTADQYADALVASRFAPDVVTAQPETQPFDELDGLFTDALSNSVEVHQASGIVSVQLGIPVNAALAMVRAHAFAEGSGLADIASQIIEHRLRLNPLDDSPGRYGIHTVVDSTTRSVPRRPGRCGDRRGDRLPAQR